MPHLLLLFALVVMPLSAAAQPSPALSPAPALAPIPAPVPIALIGQGGLFFPGPAPDRLLPGLQVEADVAIRIDGIVARAVVRQHYRNPTDRWAEALYVFPLPETAAVDALRLDIDGRLIEGRIAEKQAATAAYRAAAEAGQAAALLSQSRANLFTNRIANIPPRGTVAVEIGFDLPVDYDSGAFSLRFPMVVNPRYQPAASDRPGAPSIVAQRGVMGETGRAPYDRSRSGALNPVRLAVALNAGFALAEVTSPSHPIEAMPEGNGRQMRVTLAEGAVPADRDFVLRWRPDCLRSAGLSAGAEPCAGPFATQLTERRDGADYRLLMLLPDTALPDTALYGDLSPEDMPPDPAPPPRDLVFVIDVSGSMGGQPILQAKRALAMALARLRPQDRLQVIAFDDDLYSLFDGLRPARAADLGEALRWVAALEARGGTEMRPALAAALALPPDPERLRQIVFLTDGAVGNDVELLGLVEAGLGTARLFTVALGNAPNGFFMREAALVGRGALVSIASLEEVGARMEALFAKLERPALTDLRLVDGAGQPVSTYPERLPDLYAGAPLTAVLRDTEGLGALTLRARRNGAAWSQRIALSDGDGAQGIARLWARERLAELARQRRLSGDPAPLRAAALTTALDYGLLSEFTALVAIDQQVSRPAGEGMAAAPVMLNFPAGTHQALARIASLPATATPALLKTLVGVALLLTAGIVLWRRG